MSVDVQDKTEIQVEEMWFFVEEPEKQLTETEVVNRLAFDSRISSHEFKNVNDSSQTFLPRFLELRAQVSKDVSAGRM